MANDISGLGHQGAHPTPIEAMQRLRILLLGKGGQILVENPSVELEPEEDREVLPAEAVEHLSRQTFLEEELVISKDITSHLDLPISEDQAAHTEYLQDMETLYLTQKDIDEKLNSSSFQVSHIPTKFLEFLHI